MLKLRFCGGDTPELYRTEYNQCQNGPPRICARGKEHRLKSNSFQWTNAVRALAVLLVRSKAAMLRQGTGDREIPSILTGASGSLASSLGFALTRKCNWLNDMFGLHADGTPNARRLFDGTNWLGKQNQPTTVSLNQQMLPHESIEIYLDDRLIDRAGALEEIARQIEQNWIPKGVATEISSDDCRAHSTSKVNLQEALPIPQPFHLPEWRRELFRCFQGEMRFGLGKTNIFSAQALKAQLENLTKSESLAKLGAKQFLTAANGSLCDSRSSRLGHTISASKLEKVLKRDTPIRIAVPPAFASTIAILNYLRFEKNYNIVPDHSYTYSQEVVEEIVQGNGRIPPDGCILGLSTAIAEKRLKGSNCGSFKPVMFMPQISIRLIAPRTALKTNLNRGVYSYLSSRSYALPTYFSHLIQTGSVSKRHSSAINLEPDDATSFLANGDPNSRSLLWFPNYNFNEMFNNCVTVDTQQSNFSYQGVVLLLKGELLADRELTACLTEAIRDAWLILSESVKSLDAEVERLMTDVRYLSLLTRFGGLYQLDFNNPTHSGARAH